MTYTILTDKEEISDSCEAVTSFREAKKISDILFNALSNSDNGIGLAANQIGINKRVCVIALPDRKKIWLMNPEFEGFGDLIEFDEGCLSFPGKIIRTKRFSRIIVKADNLKKPLKIDEEKSLLECVCVQHEICHLNGETMYDYSSEKYV